jgi:hypothetical protein
MKKIRINILLLVLFHLLVFMTPVVVKSFHNHHQTVSLSQLAQKNTNLGERVKDCPVCHYEFVEAVCPHSGHIEFGFVGQSVYKASFCEVVYTPHLRYFSLRAPPLA